MGAITIDPPHSLQISGKESQHRVVTNEIEGLIRVYKDGHVERPQIVPNVTTALAPELGVTCRDMIIDKYTNIWARVYVPNATKEKKLPLLVYFHGGGFCVGAASWSCYHEFLSKLTSKTGCAVASVNYRLAPENPLPAAYDDGVKALVWIRQQEFVSRGPCKSQIQTPTQTTGNEWWASKCNFSSIFLAGDSAGANIAYNVALRAKAAASETKGLILIQPFFGGEARTDSEAHMPQRPRSALTLAASDAYWRLSLPPEASRDHPWCNPGVAAAASELRRLGVMVCVSEMDILRDRNMEWCGRMGREGVRVEQVVCKGVGHAFQILDKSCLAQSRVQELFCHIKSFVGR